MHTIKEKLKAFEQLLEIMEELRAKCPWDREQTMESLRNLTIEETYELADAILDKDLDEVRKELGDLILHIVFYASGVSFVTGCRGLDSDFCTRSAGTADRTCRTSDDSIRQ